jgi:hypothetical protein
MEHRPWSKLRHAAHRERFPLEQAGERNREAQARYRKRHAAQRAKVREVVNLLSRAPPSPKKRALRSWYPTKPDFSDLADALCACLGKAGAQALRKSLRTSIDLMDDD